MKHYYSIIKNEEQYLRYLDRYDHILNDQDSSPGPEEIAEMDLILHLVRQWEVQYPGFDFSGSM